MLDEGRRFGRRPFFWFAGVDMTIELRVIKKHANRRLYDTVAKKYVSLENIRDTINDGIDIQVEDSKTGTDITRPVLLQIMADCEQEGRPMLSPAMLMSLIRHYGHPMQDFVGPFLENSMGFYMRQEARMRKSFSDLVPDSDIAKSGREGLATMRDTLMQILTSGKSD
jgi:polyhydroxyalkanoate synthesis repressor PhaR